jgi:hypothetical protein
MNKKATCQLIAEGNEEVIKKLVTGVCKAKQYGFYDQFVEVGQKTLAEIKLWKKTIEL